MQFTYLWLSSLLPLKYYLHEEQKSWCWSYKRHSMQSVDGMNKPSNKHQAPHLAVSTAYQLALGERDPHTLPRSL